MLGRTFCQRDNVFEAGGILFATIGRGQTFRIPHLNVGTRRRLERFDRFGVASRDLKMININDDDDDDKDNDDNVVYYFEI